MISLDNLLARIEKNKNREGQITDPFLLFLNSYNIENGLDKVPTYLIYFLYRKFLVKNPEVLPLKKNIFFRTFRKQFKFKRYGKQRFYLLDLAKLKASENDFIDSRIYEKKKKV